MKGKNKVHITADLKTDLNSFAVEVSKQLAKQVRQEMLEAAQTAIIKFYTSWSPEKYKRHYYNFMENSFRGYYKNPHNQIIRGGVELTPYLMDDIYKGSSKYKEAGGDITEYVFNLVYSGYHGNIPMLGKGGYVVRTEPTPLEIIIKKRNYIVENIKTYKKDAISKANEGSYKTLRF